jgi:hypothetical protein
VQRMGENRNAFMIVVGKPEVKGLLRRPRCTYEDSIGLGNMCRV